jgi:hypothetical protein
MPQISKQILKEVIATLDAYGCGAHHPDLLPLLDQPEQEHVPFAYCWQLSPDSHKTLRWVEGNENVQSIPLYLHPPRTIHTYYSR